MRPISIRDVHNLSPLLLDAYAVIPFQGQCSWMAIASLLLFVEEMLEETPASKMPSLRVPVNI